MTSIAKFTKAQLTEALVASQAALAALQAQYAELDRYMLAVSVTLADTEQEVRRLTDVIATPRATPAVTATPNVAFASDAASAKAEAMRTGKSVRVGGPAVARTPWVRNAPTAEATAARAAYAAKVTAAKAQAARTGCSVVIA